MPVTFITDIQGPALTNQEKIWLKDEYLGGLILFTRHFQNKAQLVSLISEIKAINPKVLITVDHEGGRVQRFREGFTQVPAMGKIGALYEHDKPKAQTLAKAAAIVLAYELLEVGIDLTYAPVLDINYQRNTVIGDRGFSGKKEIVQDLASYFMQGLKEVGFAVVGKHFPGHGWVDLDSHVACPVDARTLEEIQQQDLQPFKMLLPNIDWMMPAHVVYEKVDSETAGFSAYWLQTVLRGELGFNGRIVSDDLSMQGAAIKGGYKARAIAAMDAGCDILLACNHPQASTEILGALGELNESPLNLDEYRPRVELSELTLIYMDALAKLSELK
ncbi:beta-N-acetylhexosaminidase [Oceaniserpentilla sp. 4NH20-0058]|uniref:beta-N-acetylhexosaminidase n=1 Tax=Oceaniserpentilla sp. 4NH20-0058 TaxID=3127660 RepID=UPI003104EC38